MRKVFWEDPYKTNLTTTVTSVYGNQIVPEATIIYSFVGGQESDKALINDMPVLDSKINGNLIYYTLPDNHNLQPGDIITMTIDWQRRYKLMRLHFAAELVLEIVTRKFGFEKVGAHIAEAKSRIDFISPESITPLFPSILEEYNQIITDDRPIIKDYSDAETQRRFWKIDGFANVPCGGTHVKSTAEVGFVTLKREHPGKSIERIEIRLVDDSALPARKF
jgi:Ser-tRNA(Ala) deacylase AlaX